MEEKAALLRERYSRFPDDHHLKELTAHGPRPRLKSRGKDYHRLHWRSTARRQLNEVPKGGNLFQQIVANREEKHQRIHEELTPETSTRRRATEGRPLPHSVNRSREETTLHRLRTNRARFLRQTQHRFGLVPDPICENCNQEEESVEQFITSCVSWEPERRITMGDGYPPITTLQSNPDEILSFVRLAGHLTVPPNQ